LMEVNYHPESISTRFNRAIL